jgi:hypothetical protein
MLPVLPRQPEVDEMIKGKYYFIFHAPRQSGKTTFFNALTSKINSDGNYYALYCALATVRGVTDKNEAMTTVVSRLNMGLRASTVEALKEKSYSYDCLPGMTAVDSKVQILLTQLCLDLDKELVVFFDEADCLVGPSIITFLAQIRDGYNIRANPGNKFPRSIALVGMRNIRDYLTQNHPEEQSAHLASPFNISADSITLANFTQSEIKTLYHQHTEATGQAFVDDAVDRAWYWSEGQPWLVNALANQVINNDLKNDYTVTISGNHVDQAAEGLLKRHSTHFDSLLNRLKEPRVIKVMKPVFAGADSLTSSWTNDDVLYCKDLGLVAADELERLRPANPMYRQIMAMFISFDLQQLFPSISSNIWIEGDRLLLSPLIEEFLKIWRKFGSSFPLQHQDNLAVKYDEATHAFMLFAFLQRVVNGSGARVEMQYAQGRGHVDVCAVYKGAEFPIELKVRSEERPFDQAEGLLQLAGYMDKCAAKEGWLMVFHQNRMKPWDERYFWHTEKCRDLTINVIGC